MSPVNYNFTKSAILSELFTDTQIPAKTLWTTDPILFFLIRRPGCHFCREQAAVLVANREIISTRLGVRMVAVCHEAIGAHTFAEKYFKGDTFVDTDKILFKALHGGELNFGGIGQALTSKFWSNLYRRVMTGVDGNYSEGYNDGWLLGGLMVVKKGEVVYGFQEKTFGDMPELRDVLRACAKASGRKLTEDDVAEAYKIQQDAQTYR